MTLSNPTLAALPRPQNAVHSPVVEPGTEEVTVEERVANGMAFLDERVPGWRERIDFFCLDLGTTCRCVVGQIYGHYDDGSDMLGISLGQGERLGFVGKGSEEGERAKEYPALTAAWKSALAAKGTR